MIKGNLSINKPSIEIAKHRQQAMMCATRRCITGLRQQEVQIPGRLEFDCKRLGPIHSMLKFPLRASFQFEFSKWAEIYTMKRHSITNFYSITERYFLSQTMEILLAQKIQAWNLAFSIQHRIYDRSYDNYERLRLVYSLNQHLIIAHDLVLPIVSRWR